MENEKRSRLGREDWLRETLKVLESRGVDGVKIVIIAERMGVDHLIATEPEIVNGRYTGRVAGEPAYQEGKVKRLDAWLETHRENLDGSSFYSDSHNDIPLLERVERPVAVDPDNQLAEHARSKNWPVISLRG